MFISNNSDSKKSASHDRNKNKDENKSDFSQNENSSNFDYIQILGNRTVQHLYHRGLLQAKPNLGQFNEHNNRYEQEADRVADRVMHMPDPASTLAGYHLSAADSNNDNPPSHQQDELAQDDEQLVQLKVTPSRTPMLSRSVQSKLQSLRGQGSPLSDKEIAFFEPRFRQDFSYIRLHDYAEAHQAAQSIQAKAFTFGNHIAFNQGQYTRDNLSDSRLLAHELTHAVQQSGVPRSVTSIVQRELDLSSSETPAASNLIVEDSITLLLPGQLRKSEFLAEVRAAVCHAAETILAPAGRTSDECPYLHYIFAVLERRDAGYIERTLRSFDPGLEHAASARDYIPQIVRRVEQSTRHWVETGEISGLPPNVPRVLMPNRSGSSVEPGQAGPVQFKLLNPGAPRPSDPSAIQSQLGQGRALPFAVQRRMDSAFGYDFSDLHVHTDSAAARLTRHYDARALTVGKHVAFGDGEYQPGTLIGDTLIAHELAHVVQQRQTDSNRSTTASENHTTGALERDADLSAIGVIARIWMKVNGKTQAFPQQIIPRLKSGLRLQRCTWIEYHQISEQEMGELVQQFGVSITFDPESESQTPLLVGQQIRVNIDDNVEESAYPHIHVTGWEVTTPDGETRDPLAGYTGPVTPLEYTIRQAGAYRIRVFGTIIDDQADGWEFHIDRSFNTLSPAARSEELLRTTEAQDFDRFMATQDISRTLLRPGSQEASSGQFHITTSADNPATVDEGDNPVRLNYQVTRSSGAGSVNYHWYAMPSNWQGLGDEFHGHRRISVDGQSAYDLGTGTSASWPTARSNLYVIRCVVTDSADHQIDDVNYLQSVLDQSGIDTLERIETQMTRSRTMISGLHPDYRIALPAVHVATQTGAQTQLRLFLGRASAQSSQQIMLDLTPGLDPSDHTLEFRGDGTRQVMGQFDSRNSYPEGAISLRVPQNSLGFEAGRWEFETEGASLLGVLSGRFGIGALVLGLLGLAAAPFTEGGSLVVTLLIVGSISAGITSGVLSLADRFQNAQIDTGGVMLDVASIAASFLGGAAALRVARGGTSVLVASRTTRYMLWGAFATEAVSGLLVSVEGIQEISRLVDDTSLNPADRQSAVIRIITNLIITGGLLAISGRDMVRARTRVSGALGSQVERSLSQETRLTLAHMLDDATLRSLNGASAAEIEQFARILRSDPTVAARLGGVRGQLRTALAGGAESAVDFEYTLMRLRLRQSGVSPEQSGRLADALRGADFPGASLGQIEGDLLTRLQTIDDALLSGDMSAARRGMDNLPPATLSEAGRSALEESLARAHGRTSPAWYRNPDAVLPGGQRVPPTTPGGSRFHGASGQDMAPQTVFENGMPARGRNTSIEEHVHGAPDSAFRGTTTELLTQTGGQGAAQWADAGGWVYQIEGMPSWDANQLLQGRVRTPGGGFAGNPLRGELEHLIPGHVPRERIRGVFPVVEGRGNSVRLGEFIPNPHYQAR